jgi:hypothetical protein
MELLGNVTRHGISNAKLTAKLTLDVLLSSPMKYRKMLVAIFYSSDCCYSNISAFKID